MGLDFNTIGLSEYYEAVEAWNDQEAGPQRDRPEPATDEFKAFMKDRFRAG